jgi:hypothetical protein
MLKLLMSKFIQNISRINLSSISMIFVVGILLILFLTDESKIFNNNSNILLSTATQFAYAQQEKQDGYESENIAEEEIDDNIIDDKTSSSSSSISSSNSKQQQQNINVIGTDDFTCETPIKEVVKLDEIIIKPKEAILIADFKPCEISSSKVTFNVPIYPILKLGITYIDGYDDDGRGSDNIPSIESALVIPTKVQSIDTNRGIFAIQLHDGEKREDRLTGESTTVTDIDKLYLYNSGDEPLEFKSGDNAIIRATLDK